MMGPSPVLPVVATAPRGTDLVARSLPPLLVGFCLGFLACYWYTGSIYNAAFDLAGASPGDGLPRDSPRVALSERGSAAAVGEAGGVPKCVTPAFPVEGPTSDWYSLKWVPPPAECCVAGLPIERLEPEYNYRRGYALGFTRNVEDKTHLLPYLRAAHDPSLSTRQRRVLLDLGGRTFDSSVLWFLQWYPLEFTEVHVFEALPNVFKTPPHSADENLDLLASMNSSSNVAGAGSLPVPNRVLDRVHLHEAAVSATDRNGGVNIVKFIKEELKLTAADAVIVKMDIDYAEWGVLPEWERDEELPRIVDELFLEIHYGHPSMSSFGWLYNQPREEANRVLQRLRDRGYYTHAWP